MNAKRTAKAGVVTKIRTWDPIQTTLTRRQINWTKASLRTALQVLGVRGESGMTLSRLQNNADNRSTENIAAVSRFVPRKGHNFELLSSGKLDTLGVKGQGNGMLLSLAAEEVCTNRSGHSLFECALTLRTSTLPAHSASHRYRAECHSMAPFCPQQQTTGHIPSTRPSLTLYPPSASPTRLQAPHRSY